MRLVFLLLFLILTPVISYSDSPSEPDFPLNECVVEFGKLVGAGGQIAATADANLMKISECLNKLNEKLESLETSAATALAESKSASKRAAAVTRFDERIDALELSPLGVLEQIQAQAICVSTASGPASWVSAVPRICDERNPGADCATVCGNIGRVAADGQRQSATSHACFGAIHVYSNSGISSEIGTPGLKVRRGYTCSTSSCGPNYCCCNSR